MIDGWLWADRSRYMCPPKARSLASFLFSSSSESDNIETNERKLRATPLLLYRSSGNSFEILHPISEDGFPRSPGGCPHQVEAGSQASLRTLTEVPAGAGGAQKEQEGEDGGETPR